MKNQEINIYSEPNVSFYGRIKKGCLSLTSEVYGGDDYPDSEMHLNFTKEQTNKLFSLLSLDDFLKLCREKRVSGLLEFLEANDIHPEKFVI